MVFADCNTIKISLFGKMGVGKTTVAEALIKKSGGKKLSFADPLKSDVLKYKLTLDGKIDKARDRKILQDYGQFRRGEIPQLFIKEPIGKYTGKVKEIIQLENFWGHGYVNYGHLIEESKMLMMPMRSYIGRCYPDYWVDELLGTLRKMENINVFVDDIRRENEFSVLKSENFIIIKLVADENIRKQRLIRRDGSFDETLFNNISETEIDLLTTPYVVENNREGLDDCLASIYDIVEQDAREEKETKRQEYRGIEALP